MEEKEIPQEEASLNRRKPENRWRRILRDADWDQYETVRRWLKFAREILDTKEDSTQIEEKPQAKNDHDDFKAA